MKYIDCVFDYKIPTIFILKRRKKKIALDPMRCPNAEMMIGLF
jgi:hypothetical protein